MKKFLKVVGIIILLLLVLVLVIGFIVDEPLPEGKRGEEAEQLTTKIEGALNKAAWDSTVAVSWTFAGIHEYIWDKKHHRVRTKFGGYTVFFNTQTLEGVVYNEKEMKIFGEDAQEIIQKAWENFANDSFWLIAPYKLRDPGTEREVVVVDGDTCLKITYSSGGVTPGDSYIWILDDSYQPVKWRMWVSIIPIGGIGYGWNDWVTTSTGARIATSHQGLYNIKITNLKTGMSINEVNEEDVFKNEQVY